VRFLGGEVPDGSWMKPSATEDGSAETIGDDGDSQEDGEEEPQVEQDPEVAEVDETEVRDVE